MECKELEKLVYKNQGAKVEIESVILSKLNLIIKEKLDHANIELLKALSKALRYVSSSYASCSHHHKDSC